MELLLYSDTFWIIPGSYITFVYQDVEAISAFKLTESCTPSTVNIV